MKKLLPVVIGVLVIIGGASFYYFTSTNSSETDKEENIQAVINRKIEEEKKLKQVASDVLKQKNLPECDIYLPYKKYISCLSVRLGTDINDVVSSLPEDLQENFKRDYYTALFKNPTHLVKYKVDDPIAIDIKKQYIKYLYDHMRITSPSACDKLPEQQTRQYCKDLFK